MCARPNIERATQTNSTRTADQETESPWTVPTLSDLETPAHIPPHIAIYATLRSRLTAALTPKQVALEAGVIYSLLATLTAVATTDLISASEIAPSGEYINQNQPRVRNRWPLIPVAAVSWIVTVGGYFTLTVLNHTRGTGRKRLQSTTLETLWALRNYAVVTTTRTQQGMLLLASSLPVVGLIILAPLSTYTTVFAGLVTLYHGALIIRLKHLTTHTTLAPPVTANNPYTWIRVSYAIDQLRAERQADDTDTRLLYYWAERTRRYAQPLRKPESSTRFSRAAEQIVTVTRCYSLASRVLAADESTTDTMLKNAYLGRGDTALQRAQALLATRTCAVCETQHHYTDIATEIPWYLFTAFQTDTETLTADQTQESDMNTAPEPHGHKPDETPVAHATRAPICIHCHTPTIHGDTTAISYAQSTASRFTAANAWRKQTPTEPPTKTADSAAQPNSETKPTDTTQTPPPETVTGVDDLTVSQAKAILDITDSDPSAETIDQAFRHAVTHAHPDTDTGSVAQFKRIKAAHDKLKPS